MLWTKPQCSRTFQSGFYATITLHVRKADYPSRMLYHRSLILLIGPWPLINWIESVASVCISDRALAPVNIYNHFSIARVSYPYYYLISKYLQALLVRCYINVSSTSRLLERDSQTSFAAEPSSLACRFSINWQTEQGLPRLAIQSATFIGIKLDNTLNVIDIRRASGLMSTRILA